MVGDVRCVGVDFSQTLKMKFKTDVMCCHFCAKNAYFLGT